jgi:hypothetical protein
MDFLCVASQPALLNRGVPQRLSLSPLRVFAPFTEIGVNRPYKVTRIGKGGTRQAVLYSAK